MPKFKNSAILNNSVPKNNLNNIFHVKIQNLFHIKYY